MLDINSIRSLHIELTTRCNARCPMCMRNYRGYSYNSGYPITELLLEDIQKIFSIDFLKQIRHVNFNGNLGDFSNAKDALKIVDYFLTNSTSQIQIETNGSANTPEWWAQLANRRITILFALDGLEDTHSTYRIDTNWNKVIANAKSVINNNGNAVWKFIPFMHNKHQINECKALAKDLGFTDFTLWDQGRNQTPVYSRKGEFEYWIGTNGWPGGIPKVTDLLNNHLSWFDPSIKMSIDIDESSRLNCISMQNQEIYLAADGSIYPCCFTGFYPETMHQPGNSQIKPMIKNNNALEYPLSECVEWFTTLQKSWDLPDIMSGKPYICLNTCRSR